MATTRPSPPNGPGALPGAEALAERLDIILNGLLIVVAAHFRVLAHFTLPAWTRISRARQRLARVLAWLANGTYPRLRPNRPGAPPRKGGPPAPYVPRGKLWLIAKIGYQAAGRGAQIQYLLDDPQTRAVLDAAPAHAVAAIARALRPIARTLGITLPPQLQPPAKPPLPPKPRTPKPPRPKLPPLLPLHPQRRPRDMPFMNFTKKITP